MRISYQGIQVLELEEKLITGLTANGWKVLDKKNIPDTSGKVYTQYDLQGNSPFGMPPCVRMIVSYYPKSKDFGLCFRPFKYWDDTSVDDKAKGFGKCPYWWVVALSGLFTLNIDIIISPTRFMIFTEQNSKWVKQAYVGFFLPFVDPRQYEYPMLVTATTISKNHYEFIKDSSYKKEEPFMCYSDKNYYGNEYAYATFFNQEGFSANITYLSSASYNYNNGRLTHLQSFSPLHYTDWTYTSQNGNWNNGNDDYLNNMTKVQTKSEVYNGNVFGLPIYIVGDDKTSAGKVIGILDGLYYPLCTVEHNSTTTMQDKNIYKNQKSNGATLYYSYIYDEVK